jgi:2,7-dihydroxy-5-methyl-1-naphthoate 7-O-methyltransferase
MADIWELTDLTTPWCMHTVVTLRIPEHLDAGHADVGALAAAAGCDRDALARVLRHLVGRGVFAEPAPDTFALTDLSRQLLDPSVRLGLDLDLIGGRMAGAWSTLPTAVRTGRPAYHEAFGRPFWADLEAHPVVAESFDALMGPPGHGVPDPDILIAEGWGSVRHVVDVGGGTGALLAEILRAHPGVRGTLVDLPRTVARFAHSDVAERVTLAGQSFFDPLPPGADVYVVKSVLSDWPDDDARAILARCAEAAHASFGRVIVHGGVSPTEPGHSELLMLVLVGGKGRGLAEFRALAASAGLDVVAAGTNAAGRFIVECRPSSSVEE